MSGISESLILKEQAKAAAEPFLFSEDDLPRIDKTKPKWHCTGEYLKKLRPDIYDAAVTMLLEPGLSLRMICRTLHVSHNTLSSIQERENLDTETRKKAILKTITRGLRVSAERVEELAPEMDARNAIIAVGVLTEKMQLLGGEPTARLEVGRFDLGAELRKLEATALDAMRQAKARVIDPPALEDGTGKVIEIGVKTENTESKGAMNGDHEQLADARNSASNAVIHVTDALAADESDNDVGETI